MGPYALRIGPYAVAHQQDGMPSSLPSAHVGPCAPPSVVGPRPLSYPLLRDDGRMDGLIQVESYGLRHAVMPGMPVPVG